MTLYQMQEEALSLYDQLQEAELNDVERKAIIDDTLEAMGVEDKLIAYAQVKNQFEADRAMIKAEIARLQEQAKRCDKNIDRLVKSVALFMDALDIKKTNAGTFSFGWRKSTKCEIDEALLPDMYWKAKLEPDKATVKELLKSGEEIPGARLVENRSVIIK